MPRMARVDYPGALHHLIVRGIERRIIFEDDADRGSFVRRLESVLRDTNTPCFAWALIPNHIHLLLVTGKIPIGRVMQRVLTGYAADFNRRHRRSGHLFQNRYKSVLCDKDAYLLELVRYIHLNPLRARQAETPRELEGFPWSGHAVILGRRTHDWQDTDEVLGLFGKRRSNARRAYREFVLTGIEQGKRPDLTGGGLIRSLGGWVEVIRARREKRRELADARILGDGAFVENVLRHIEERESQAGQLKRKGWNPDKVMARAAGACRMSVENLRGNRKYPEVSRARGLACFWMVEHLGE
ncbi:MAG: transposase, partial [Planctomycetota bacterium]